MTIETMDELIALLRTTDDISEYADVKVRRQGDLALLGYTARAQYAGRWNWIERVSRGLILNVATGEIVARPFDKFYNWGERTTDANIVTITEKIDGSLGILYRQNGEHKIATRGSFDSDQALWATKHLKRYDLSRMISAYTLLFEIVYPDNRVVVDYGDTADLYLLAGRNRHTGKYLPFRAVKKCADRLGVPTPRTYAFNTTDDIVEAAQTLPATAEGWVVEFSDGQRFKFKGADYVELHRLVTNASYKRVLDACKAGTFDKMIAGVPDEFLDQIREWKTEIDTVIFKTTWHARTAMDDAPRGTDRKTFALWVREHHPDLAPYLFALLDNKPLTPLIYKREFK